MGAPFAARKGHTTRLTTPHCMWRTIEVVVAVPILWAFNATALQPIFLDPINEILLIRILPVVRDKSPQTLRSLLLNPPFVLEYKPKHPNAHLHQQQNCEEDGIGCQEAGILPQSTHTSREANHKGYCPNADENEGWIEGDIGKLWHIVEDVLLSPRPNSHSQDAQAQNLQLCPPPIGRMCNCRRSNWPPREVLHHSHPRSTSGN